MLETLHFFAKLCFRFFARCMIRMLTLTEQLVHDDAQGPHVNFLWVRWLSELLWRHIKQGACSFTWQTAARAMLFENGRNTEIYNLNRSAYCFVIIRILSHYYIFRFQVSVHNIFWMNQFNSLEQTFHNLGHLTVSKWRFSLKQTLKPASRNILHFNHQEAWILIDVF